VQRVRGHVTDNRQPPAPQPLGLYSFNFDDDETPIDRQRIDTPSARPAMSQAEANLRMIEQALISLKSSPRPLALGVLDDLAELAREARANVLKGRP
jgi:hypothetical protein